MVGRRKCDPADVAEQIEDESRASVFRFDGKHQGADDAESAEYVSSIWALLCGGLIIMDSPSAGKSINSFYFAPVSFLSNPARQSDGQDFPAAIADQTYPLCDGCSSRVAPGRLLQAH